MTHVWFNKLSSVLKSSPLASNVVIGFFMTALEKVMDMEFVCPCKHCLNLLFGIFYFVVPAVMAYWFLRIVQCKKCYLAGVIWIVLVLMDGQYLQCMFMKWEGDYVEITSNPKLKWCKPFNEWNSTALQRQSESYIIWSQGSGMILLVVVTVLELCTRCLLRKAAKDLQETPTNEEVYTKL